VSTFSNRSLLPSVVQLDYHAFQSNVSHHHSLPPSVVRFSSHATTGLTPPQSATECRSLIIYASRLTPRSTIAEYCQLDYHAFLSDVSHHHRLPPRVVC
jgi:hypothetical protein